MPGWSTFQSTVAPYLDNPIDGKTHAETAEKIASEYHKAVATAQTTFHGTILTTQPPYAPLKMAIEDALNQISKSEGPPQLHHFTQWSAATVAYWASTQYALLPFHPLAMIASTGTVGIPIPISNIAISGGTPSPLDAGLLAAFTHPAVNSPMGDIVCGKLILAWTAHLTTVMGVHTHTVIGGTPATPATPIVLPTPWVGLILPPAGSGGSLISSIADTVTDLLTMSLEHIEAAKLEMAGADVDANDTTLPAAGRGTASEYSKLKASEIKSGQIAAATVDLTEEELAAIEENTPDEYKCEVGTKIVALAKRDIGILEYGTPPGLNYGGFPGGEQLNQRGRIDDMFDNVGLNNQSKVKKTGSGYYWCAAAVATWWKEAGLETPNGGASCQNWMVWGKSKGYWSSEPKIGAAVLYGKPSHAHHIGIVAGVTATGGVITIEGNTSGGGFSRNGVGVFQKIPKAYLGFVNPPSCVSTIKPTEI